MNKEKNPDLSISNYIFIGKGKLRELLHKIFQSKKFSGFQNPRVTLRLDKCYQAAVWYYPGMWYAI